MKYDHFHMLPEQAFKKVGGQIKVYMGGGGSSQPTNTTVTNTNIPEYAQPYVGNMMNAAQAQIYNKDMTGFNKFTPYSANPTDYVAGFSPLQQQGFSSLANMDIAPQIAMGTDLANRASAGAMDSAPVAYNYGAQGYQSGNTGQNIGTQGGLGYGSQAAGLTGAALGAGAAGMQSGMSYGQNAQNPYAVASYMNPYIENTLRPSLQLLNQQYGMQGAQEQGAATSAGAFGGSREALMQGLNQQNRNLAGNQLVSNAYNNAYNTANQNMQQAAGLGMQGAQTGLAGISGANQLYGTGLQGVNTALAGTAQGMQGAQTGLQGVAGAQAGYGLGIQGANTLNNLANTQYNQQMGIAQAQMGAGAQQQGQQQNIINQAVQNYATEQQYPYMQLGQLNAMLRGLPMQQSTTQMYQAPPSTVSQLGGAGIAGLGAASMYNAATKAEGGVIKMASGGSAIPMSRLSDQQLSQVQQSPASSPLAKINALGLEQLHGYMKNNPQAGQMMQQASQVPEPVNARSGIASIATGDMTQMAGGGIIAFADGSKGAVEEPVKEDVIPRGKDGEIDYGTYLANRLAAQDSGKNSVATAYKPLAEAQAEDIKQQRAMLLPELATRFGLGLMGSQGGRGGSLLNRTLQDVGASGLGTLQDMSSKLKDIEAAKKTMQQGTIESTKADQARRDATTNTIAQVFGTIEAKKIGLAQAAATRANGLDAKEAALLNAASSQYQNTVERVFKDLATQQKNAMLFENEPEKLWALARRQVYEAMPEVTRKLLNLEPPVAAPVVAQTAPPVTPPRSSIFNGNPAMPPTPAGTMRWDPSANGGKGALVPIK